MNGGFGEDEGLARDGLSILGQVFGIQSEDWGGEAWRFDLAEDERTTSDGREMEPVARKHRVPLIH